MLGSGGAILVVDCGSGHTGAILYTMTSSDGTPSEEKLKKIKLPPLVATLTEGAKGITKFVDSLASDVLATGLSFNKIFVGATAGLRAALEEGVVNNDMILSFHKELCSHPDLKPSPEFKVLSGVEEARYEHIAVGVIASKCLHSDSLPVGLISSGGVSSQLAFYPEHTSKVASLLELRTDWNSGTYEILHKGVSDGIASIQGRLQRTLSATSLIGRLQGTFIGIEMFGDCCIKAGIEEGRLVGKGEATEILRKSLKNWQEVVESTVDLALERVEVAAGRKRHPPRLLGEGVMYLQILEQLELLHESANLYCATSFEITSGLKLKPSWSSGYALDSTKLYSQPISMDPVAIAKAKLSKVCAGSNVAIITYQGSFCPVTLGHILCPVTARDILLRNIAAPTSLEQFHEVIGLLKCNGDSFVKSKMSKKDPPVPIIPYEDRMMLIGKATEEMDWLFPHDNPRGALASLQDTFANLNIIHYSLCGADDAIKYRKWTNATENHRVICLGRPADPGQDNGTEGVRKAMEHDSIDVNAGLFILGPELPDISSTAVRKALKTNDKSALKTLLHPNVMTWNLTEGPYAPTADCKPDSMSSVLGEFVFRRSKKPFVTHVRKVPTASRADHVFHWNMMVADGDIVCLLYLDPTYEFAYIEFDKGEGWVAIKYLHCLSIESGRCTMALHQRRDGVSGTPLRKEPSERHSWVRDAKVQNGELVRLLEPHTENGKWNYFLVRYHGVDGWLKLRNLAFALSGFRHELLRAFHENGLSSAHKHESTLQLFAKFDSDSSGTIEKHELQAVITELCPAFMTPSSFDALYQEFDINGDGKIQYAEFLEWVFSSS